MKKIFVLLLTLLLTGMLFGCGMSEEDAKAYVQASLDAIYKGEFEAFVEITDSTPEGAQAIYKENIKHEMENAGFTDLNLSEELMAKYDQLFIDLVKNVDYTVGDAVKTEEDSLAVEVIVHPLKIYDNLTEEVIEAQIARIDGMEETPSEEQIIEISYEEMYKIVSKRLENPVYSEEEHSVTIHIHKNEDKKYAISEEDMRILDDILFEDAAN